MILPSIRIVVSYILDWVAIIIIAAIGAGLNYVTPSTRPFSLLDLSISYPLVAESISVPTLAVVSLLAPAVIIAIITLALIPGPRTRRSFSRSQTIRRKLWELHAGLIGLALSVAAAFFITQGLKNIFPKPRPHFIALCQPDVTNIRSHVVGGYGQVISERWTLVDSSICTQQDSYQLNDGFRSFPSGHCSFSWSGLLYLSLFICAKFSIAIPYLSYFSTPSIEPSTQRSDEMELLPIHQPAAEASSSVKGNTAAQATNSSRESQVLPLYSRAAAPPTYGLIVVLIPVSVAVYICSTRYTEFWHFGFDVISGSLIGIFTAWSAFRWYHLPIPRGQGWAWGPRTRDRAFGVVVGTAGYVGEGGWMSVRGLAQANAAEQA